MEALKGAYTFRIDEGSLAAIQKLCAEQKLDLSRIYRNYTYFLLANPSMLREDLDLTNSPEAMLITNVYLSVGILKTLESLLEVDFLNLRILTQVAGAHDQSEQVKQFEDLLIRIRNHVNGEITNANKLMESLERRMKRFKSIFVGAEEG